MGKMTLVFEFEDGKEPVVNAGMEFVGGRIVAVSFFDYRDDFFTTEQRDVIAGMVEDAEWHDHVEEKEATDIMDKVELLTL